MSKALWSAAMAGLAVVAFSSILCAQGAQTAPETETSSYMGTVDGWTGQPGPQPANKPGTPAPRRDIFGIWDPGNGGIQAMGAAAMPEDGKPEHRPAYT